MGLIHHGQVLLHCNAIYWTFCILTCGHVHVASFVFLTFSRNARLALSRRSNTQLQEIITEFFVRFHVESYGKDYDTYA